MNKIAIVIGLLIVVVGSIVGFLLLADEQTEDTVEDTAVQAGQAASDLAQDGAAETSELVDDVSSEAVDKEFNISGTNYAFSETTLSVAAGDTVKINFTAASGTHDFIIDDLDGARTSVVSNGDMDSITFTVPEDASGKSYSYYCSIGNHRAQGMEGTLNVE